MEQVDIPYQVVYRNIKHPRIEMRTGKIIIILPPGDSPKRILEKYRNWIKKRIKIIRHMIKNSKGKHIEERTEKEFKELIQTLVKQYSKELGIKLPRIFIRKMRTKWASYSTNGNITINRLAKYLPTYLINYLIYHELTHSIEKRHNYRFWYIISKKFPHHNNLEKELFTYWFTITKQISEHKK